MPVSLLAATLTRVMAAAALRVSADVSTVDAFVAAAAIEHSCPVLTTDPDFSELQESVGIEFLR